MRRFRHWPQAPIGDQHQSRITAWHHGRAEQATPPDGLSRAGRQRPILPEHLAFDIRATNWATRAPSLLPGSPTRSAIPAPSPPLNPVPRPDCAQKTSPDARGPWPLVGGQAPEKREVGEVPPTKEVPDDRSPSTVRRVIHGADRCSAGGGFAKRVPASPGPASSRGCRCMWRSGIRSPTAGRPLTWRRVTTGPPSPGGRPTVTWPGSASIWSRNWTVFPGAARPTVPAAGNSRSSTWPARPCPRRSTASRPARGHHPDRDR